jgi:pimeloyl-ACP methyl ester carboxylesterase
MDDAVVIPGGAFGPGAGMLMYAPLAAERRGAIIHRHHWSEQPEDVLDPTIEAWVRGEMAPLLDAVVGRPLLIGKSLGTNAAGVAAERGLPAIWLTPLLTLPWVVDALSRATAPVLLIGGSADRWWDGEVARRLSTHVLEVAGADHGMLVSGPAIDSIAVLGQVITTIEDFLDVVG